MITMADIGKMKDRNAAKTLYPCERASNGGTQLVWFVPNQNETYSRIYGQKRKFTSVKMLRDVIPVAKSRIVNVHGHCYSHSSSPAENYVDVAPDTSSGHVADGLEDGLEPVNADPNQAEDGGLTKHNISCHPGLK